MTGGGIWGKSNKVLSSQSFYLNDGSNNNAYLLSAESVPGRDERSEKVDAEGPSALGAHAERSTGDVSVTAVAAGVCPCCGSSLFLLGGTEL